MFCQTRTWQREECEPQDAGRAFPAPPLDSDRVGGADHFLSCAVYSLGLFLAVGPDLSFELNEISLGDVLKAIGGGGLSALLLTYVITRWLPS